MNPLEQLIQEYIAFSLETRSDGMLNANIKAQIMLQMAQSLNVLVPLIQNNGQAELELKAQEHQMNMTAKQQEMEMKAQEHAMKLQQSQNEHGLKLQQAQDNHQNSLVQSQQAHLTKLEQQKANAKQESSKNSSGTTV